MNPLSATTRPRRWLLLLLLLSPAAHSYDLVSYCNTVTFCLGTSPPQCSRFRAGTWRPSELQCSLAREGTEHGIAPDSLDGRLYYDFLGRQRFLDYSLEGELPLSAAVMQTLMDELPLAALLVNAYQETEYTVRYRDARRLEFTADNGRNLKGRIRLISSPGHSLDRVYLGRGSLDFLFWRFIGRSMIYLKVIPREGEQSRYSVRFLIVPNSDLVAAILDSGLFRRTILGTVTEMVDQVVASAGRFIAGDLQPLRGGEVFAGRADLRDGLQRFIRQLPPDPQRTVLLDCPLRLASCDR